MTIQERFPPNSKAYVAFDNGNVIEGTITSYMEATSFTFARLAINYDNTSITYVDSTRMLPYTKLNKLKLKLHGSLRKLASKVESLSWKVLNSTRPQR